MISKFSVVQSEQTSRFVFSVITYCIHIIQGAVMSVGSLKLVVVGDGAVGKININNIYMYVCS